MSLRAMLREETENGRVRTIERDVDEALAKTCKAYADRGFFGVTIPWDRYGSSTLRRPFDGASEEEIKAHAVPYAARKSIRIKALPMTQRVLGPDGIHFVNYMGKKPDRIFLSWSQSGSELFHVTENSLETVDLSEELEDIKRCARYGNEHVELYGPHVVLNALARRGLDVRWSQWVLWGCFELRPVPSDLSLEEQRLWMEQYGGRWVEDDFVWYEDGRAYCDSHNLRKIKGDVWWGDVPKRPKVRAAPSTAWGGNY